MARAPVLAAGGIVLRAEKNPRIAVVRLRKRNEWVLPKGKLDDGETPRAAAEREVLEETGHDVRVHEFLGTLVYDFGGRSKVVHYWRMEAGDAPVHELMHDIRAVDWLPLDDAVERLSRGYERVFLANVGPIALQAAAAAAAETARRARAKQPAPEKRRSRAAPSIAPPPSAPAPSAPEPMPAVAAPDFAEAAQDESVLVESAAMKSEAPADADEFRMVPQPAEIVAADSADNATTINDQPMRRSLVRKVRDWFLRAA
ncbi:MAG TPA: NUDIX hydrolase [Bradyrhizobium sp.]